MKKNNQKGFTLIELLVVIAIIGLLSTLAVVSLNNARTKSRDARRVADVKQIQTAMELYFTDISAYPAVTAANACGGTHGAGIIEGCCLSATNGFLAACAGNVYMGQVPTTPMPGGTPYTYTPDGTTSYGLTYTLEQGTGGIPVGLRTATPSGIYTN